MNVETLNKRIESCKLNIEKLENKLSRILKAEESNYELNNPYYYSDYDKRSTLRDIEETKQKLAKYETELQVTTEKDNSRNVQAIVDFLNQWKERVYSIYEKALNACYEENGYVYSLYKKFTDCKYHSEEYKKGQEEYNEARLALHRKLHGTFELRDYTNPYTNRVEHHKVKVADGCWEFLKNYVNRGSREDAFNKLEKDLTEEWKSKYDFIIERTNKIVGQIEDATDLKIGGNGELNGIIVGSRGKAKVETIGAGGHNIQIFHYRVLVKEVK